MILVTGATGQLGKEVLSLLSNKVKANNLSAIARQPEKLDDFSARGVKVHQADFNNYQSLVKAFKGVDKLYFVSSSEIGQRIEQHTNVVNAAIEMDVKHIIYTSFQRKTEDPNSPIALIANDHLVTEKLIKQSGITYTILKHALYLDVLPMFFGPTVLQNGVFLPAGNGSASYASRNDMAHVASIILTQAGHENKSYDISAPRSYSFVELAEMLSTVTGKSIGYHSPDVATFNKILQEAGVPNELIGLTTAFCQGIEQGEFDSPSNTLETLLGRTPQTPIDYLRTIY